MNETDHNDGDEADRELIRRYAAGDNGAFDVLYERYKRPLYAYLNRLMSGRHDQADDLFQQVWLRIIASLPQYECRQRFLSWALRIAHNLAIDSFRRQERDPVALPEDADNLLRNDLEPWRHLDRAELSAAIGKALKTLSPELREVFALRLEKVSFKEIAELQGCSINTVLGRMHYALKNLQRVIKQTEYGEGKPR